MTSLVEQYESEYNELAGGVSRKVDMLRKMNGERRKAVKREIESDISEAERVLHQLDLEVRSLPPSSRTRVTPRLRNYQNDLQQLKRNMKRNNEMAESRAQRDQLFAGQAEDDHMADKLDQRARLLDGHDRLAVSTRRIEDSQRLAAETEAIGTGVLTDLGQQREVIVRANENLSQADDNLTRGRKLVQSMGRRVITNKLILAFVILILMGTIVMLIYFKWLAPLPSPPPPPPPAPASSTRSYFTLRDRF